MGPRAAPGSPGAAARYDARAGAEQVSPIRRASQRRRQAPKARSPGSGVAVAHGGDQTAEKSRARGSARDACERARVWYDASEASRGGQTGRWNGEPSVAMSLGERPVVSQFARYRQRSHARKINNEQEI